MERSFLGMSPSSFQIVFAALLNVVYEVDSFQNVVNCMVSDYWGTHNSDLKQVAPKDNHSSDLSFFFKEDM